MDSFLSILSNNPKARIKLKSFFFLVFQLGLLELIIYRFNFIQETHFDKILPVIYLGFITHFWTPKKFKLLVFILISFASIIAVLGVFNGLVLIAIGLILLGMCHLPINFYLKLLIITCFTAVLVLIRTNLILIEPVNTIIPFIGTIFMLRLIIYLYEVKHSVENSKPAFSLAYFFMLPNVCFPLFPLVDYKTMNKTYFNENDLEIYLTGIERIFRGVTHLIAYRIIYYFFIPSPNELTDVLNSIQFILFNYALILRLSGLFHISIGILGLFGFNLPEIFNNYFFASSFNDIWKRINIYWREALMKVFYYPLYFVFRKVASGYALAITIMIIFIINWVLHGYQWLWIKGSFPLEPNDFLFWLVFGLVVMINSVYLQLKPTQKRIRQKNTKMNYKDSFVQVLKPVGMFCFMSIIWSLWSSASIKEWLYILSLLGMGTPSDATIVVGGIIIILLFLLILNRSYHYGILNSMKQFFINYKRQTTPIFIVLLFTISFPFFTPFLKINNIPFITFLQENKLNERDKRKMERGYYQKLLSNDGNSLQLASLKIKEPKTWYKNDAYEVSNSILRKTLKPNYTTNFKNAPFKTNAFGMRDKDYYLEKDSNTYRFALLGGSYEMGAGILEEETFQAVVEKSLNEKLNKKIEILNFSVGGYHLIENEVVVNNCLQYQPEAVIYTAHSYEFIRLQNRIIDLLEDEQIADNKKVKQLKKITGIEGGMCRLEKQNRLTPYIKNILSEGYESIVRKCRANNSIPIWMYIPALGDNEDESYSEILKIAKDKGFITIPIIDPYRDLNKIDLCIAPWDFHLNKKGHYLIGEKMFEKLIANKQQLNLE